MKKKTSIMGGGAKASTTKLKSFVALGLSAVLPSLAFSAESDEALKQLLTAPQAPSDSKVKSVENYSPIVDLRSSRAQTQYDEVWNNKWAGGDDVKSNPFVWNKNTTILITTPYYFRNAGDISHATIYEATNGATVTFDVNVNGFASMGLGSGVLTTNYRQFRFTGDGNFVINANVNQSNSNSTDAFWVTVDYYGDDRRSEKSVVDSKSFVFKASGNLGAFFKIMTGPDSSGKHYFNSSTLIIDMYNDGKNSNNKKYVYLGNNYYSYSSTPTVGFNVNPSDFSQANDKNMIMQLTGNLGINVSHFYAHFTNANSFLKGNIEALNTDKNRGSIQITFSNGSKMEGDIDIGSNRSGKITFDNANFIGSIKNSQNNGNGSNTTITFKNTAENTFGDGTNDIVASSYKGNIVGSFDVSANSLTTIDGGSKLDASNQGSKGFQGSGTNTLFFDFKGNAKSSATPANSFTISGGNANSIYVFNNFKQQGGTELDLSQLSQTETLYKKIGTAGINIKAGTKILDGQQNTNNVLQGTLFFQKTGMTVDTGANALFASAENIVGAGNDLNKLTMGAMFGNATWNDANKDGNITGNEIKANAGKTNYKLNSKTTSSGSGIDTNTSTGNIGITGDNIKKQVAFIFTDDTYLFGGGNDVTDKRYDKQGYSGTISGGTNDSKYYFANAGYINRSQIENAQGDLVLFNTAFRGDLGVDNKDVSILLDFSDNRNGLRSERGSGNSNIVGAGSKNVTFNFTDNTQAVKFQGAVIGNSTKNNADPASGTADSQTAKYTMLNLIKYSSDGAKDGDGSLKISGTRSGVSDKTLVKAIQDAGLTNFGKDIWGTSGYPSSGSIKTDVTSFADNTILGLKGTSLDVTNMDFSKYVYDLAFGTGAEIGEVEGVTLKDSKLKGTIDLTGASNTNAGHSFVFKGTAIEGDTSGVLATAGKLAGFSYDDSTATYSQPVTFKLSGLSQANYVTTNGNGTTVTGDSLVFTQTKLEGNLWADNSVAVNLDFTNGRTWKMDSSGLYLKSGSNLIIHGAIEAITAGQTPTLGIRTSANLQDIQLINTGVSLTWNNDTGYSTDLSQTFVLRGTGLQPHSGQRISGRVNSGKSNFNMVFAKGINLQTIVMDAQTGGTAYDLTNIGVNTGWVENEEGTRTQLTHKGTYSDGVYDGNYVATSSGDIRGTNTDSGFDITFIGSQAWSSTEEQISTENYFGQASTLTLVNASNKWENGAQNVNGISAGYLGKFFQRNIGTQATIIVEGTSIDWGNEGDNGGGIVRRDENQDKLTFKMTFINEEGLGGSNTDSTYVGDKYTDLATTNANGALSDSVLKVQESKLVNGLNFKGANAFVTFVGDGAQSLDGTGGGNQKILNGGSAQSIFTFRDSDLNAGSTASSIQNIKGTIAFDLTHTGEDMQISGTLRNMLATGGKHQVQFTGRGDSAQPVTLNRLVFVKMSDLTTLSDSLGKFDDSPTAGQYFNDADTFGSLAQADYSDLALLAGVNNDASSSLTFADNATIALESGEVIFVGANSHKFDADSGSSPNKLGDSTGGTLTFVDAGTLKVDNLINESSGTQGGKGTINLIGNTKIEAQSITQGGQSAPKNTLSLKKNSSTGNGITINAVFSASNALADNNSQTIGESSVRSRAGSSTLTGASTYDIGQTDEKTIYHLLFDYTSSNLTFGAHHAYTGNIYGLTSDSVIKFKNAGYIDQSQIANTQATILVDNTQIKGDFRGDSAILDFRNNHPAISGNILTSDKTNANLSQKVLTFDLTGSTKKPIFSGIIQAGYKVAPSYSVTQADLRQSVLTFQNATTLSLGDDNTTARGTNTNPSVFIKALANDAGFSGIGSAETKDTNFASNQSKAYILEGTKLSFQGTNITAGSGKTISEDTYSLDLSFDTSATRGATGLGETLKSSTLTANSIVMGELAGSNPLGLSLSFKGANSLNADGKKLDVKVKENAIFNLNAQGSEKIGTIVLSQNKDGGAFATLDNVAKESSIKISAGSMDFVGQFIQKSTGSNAGAIDVAFNGTNKAYGVIAGQGDMKVTISGDALYTDTEATALGYTKDSTKQFADLVIDLSSATSSTLKLSHTSGMVGLIGASSSSYASANLNNVAGSIAVKGNFDLGQANITLADSKLKVHDDTFFKVGNNSSITLADSTSETSKSLTINATGGATTNWKVDLTLTNLDPKLTVKLTNTASGTSWDNWNDQGVWNIRGTNINIDRAFWSNSDVSKTFVFAKGSGTQVVSDSQTPLTLDALTGADKINASSLSGYITSSSSGGHSQGIAMKGSFTFIGKEALGVDPSKQNIDGMKSDGNDGNVTFNLYNSLLKNGSILLDKTANGNMNNTTITDTATLRGTDTFNLSVSKKTSNGANNSTIDAVYVNGTTSGSDNSVTGVRYIDASGNHAYASAYATSNAGGALSETQLKTLESKAYGNITLDNTVTATMKFIGENSHSFDGKTKVDSSGNVYYSADGSTGWKQYEIDTTGTGGKVKGAVYLGTTTTTSGTLATLTGGNANSRFDFDHTTVSLEQIKGAGGSTYVYNSTLKGAINVSNGSIPADSSTTLIFNAQMSKEQAPDARTAPSETLSWTSQVYLANNFESKGINIDFSKAHQLTVDNLNGGTTNAKTLANTSKATNLVFIGKGSVNIAGNTAVNNNGDSIDISFMPSTLASGYESYTFVDAGTLDESDIKARGFGTQDKPTIDPSGADKTVFGTSKVMLINTYVTGARDFADTGFINAGEKRNQKSTWGGGDGIEQYLIFDFRDGTANQSLQQSSSGTIQNTDTDSRYIFTNMFDANTEDSARVLTLSGTNSLKTAINTKLNNGTNPTSNPVIGNAVKGYLGLRGVSIQGNINENTTSGNGVDIVFNSTDNISYIDNPYATNPKERYSIVKNDVNMIANADGINNDKSQISGYAILKSTDGQSEVTISGTANKSITFIGANSVSVGFDNLKIQDGGADSTYTFYEVGTLSQTFLANVGLYNSSQNTQATAGSFTFENVAILDANINVNQNSNRSDSSTNVLTFKNVDFSGEIGGTLKKNLAFGANTDNVKISGGSDDSSYDFSNLAGKSINLDIDMTKGSGKYYASSVAGFENGDISLTGSIKLAKNSNETDAGYSYSNSFAFNNDASWSVTDDSRVMNLSLSNSGTNYNIDLASAPRTTTKASGKDLRVLEVGRLSGNGGQILLGTMIAEEQKDSKSDRIETLAINSGSTLYVTAQDPYVKTKTFDTQTDAIVLVTAEINNGGEVKGAERKQGLSYAITEIEHQTSNDGGANWTKVEDESLVSQGDSHRWVLSAFNTETNQELVDESGFVVSNPYRMLMIETNNLNKRMGDLRDDNYNQGAWIRVFNGMDSGEGAKNLYTNIQLGYDYGTPAIGAKNYTGVAFSTSIVDIDGNQYHGKANTYSLGVYNAYIADSGLYVDTIAKYLYTDQKLGVNGGGSDDSFGSHALSLGVEVGYRAYMGETNFYFEPQAEVIGGMIFGVKDINMGVIGGMNVTGELKTTTAINTRVGLVQGYSLKTESGFRADFRLGASLVNEFISEDDPVRLSDGITDAGTSIGNDVKVVVNVGTNLILTDQWRVYIDAERSFGGNRNTDYQANVGARFSFGDKLTSLPKPEKPLPLKLKSEEKKEQGNEPTTPANTQEAKK